MTEIRKKMDEIYTRKKDFKRKIVDFANQSENDLSPVEGFKVHQALVVIDRDVPNFENLHESLSADFAKVLQFGDPEDKGPQVYLVYTIGNKAKYMLTIKQIKLKFKSNNVFWDSMQVWGTTQNTSHVREFLTSLCIPFNIVVDGDLVVEDEFDFYSAQEFCVAQDITDAHQLMKLYTSLKSGSPLKEKTKIPGGVLKSQEQNARAIFKSFSNPLLQMKSVVEAAASRRVAIFRTTPKLDFIFKFLRKHETCCFVTFFGSDERIAEYKLNAIWKWFNYMELIPFIWDWFFCAP